MNKILSVLTTIFLTAVLAACSATAGGGISPVAHYDGGHGATVVLAASGLDLKANMESPSGFCTVGGSGGDRTVWVLSDKPYRVALLGNSRQGNELPCAQMTEWQQTGRGWMTQVSFPSSYASSFNTLRLVREDGKGWSDWNKQDFNEMAYLRHSNVGRGDPACVGGRSWCAVRGL